MGRNAVLRPLTPGIPAALSRRTPPPPAPDKGACLTLLPKLGLGSSEVSLDEGGREGRIDVDPLGSGPWDLGSPLEEAHDLLRWKSGSGRGFV